MVTMMPVPRRLQPDSEGPGPGLRVSFGFVLPQCNHGHCQPATGSEPASEDHDAVPTSRYATTTTKHRDQGSLRP
jgi:hypothetical protein